MEAICRVLIYESGDTKTLCSEMARREIRDVISAQQDIGLQYLSRGFIVTAWLRALKDMVIKGPEQKMTHLLDIIWFQYVERIWTARNDIMHNQENFYSQEENNELGRQIRWYVEHRAEVLKHGDQFLANIDLSRLPWMRRKRKQK